MQTTDEKEIELTEERGESWEIRDDNTADWAVQKIADSQADFERIKSIALHKIDEINKQLETASKRFDSETGFLKGKLYDYFLTVPHKATKTQEKYQLLSGALKLKKGGLKLVADEANLLPYLQQSGATEFIKTKESVAWGDFKKRIIIQDGLTVDKESGEVVPGITVEENPDTFEIEL